MKFCMLLSKQKDFPSLKNLVLFQIPWSNRKKMSSSFPSNSFDHNMGSNRKSFKDVTCTLPRYKDTEAGC